MAENAKEKQKLMDAARKACGNKFNVEKYYGWRIKHANVTVDKTVDVAKAMVTFKYPCSHQKTVPLTSPESVRMRLADYHYPECPRCREATYKASCKEETDRLDGLTDLGLIIEEGKIEDHFEE